MRNSVFIMLITGLLMVACAFAAPAAPLYKANGFSIQPLQATPPQEPYQVVMMFLPPSGGFSPNVNVQIQTFTSTLDIYMRVSKAQFLANGMKVIKEKRIGKNSAVVEYIGTMQGQRVHIYVRLVIQSKKVYLATATATEKQWQIVSKPLKACVDSFKVDPPTAHAKK